MNVDPWVWAAILLVVYLVFYRSRGSESGSEVVGAKNDNSILVLTPSDWKPRKRKVLTIGIDYVGTSIRLDGCRVDTRNISAFFASAPYQVQPEDIVSLSDDSRVKPTAANIQTAIQWLVHDLRPGDERVFHYSGHGTQVVDKERKEADGLDECIVPLDYTSKGKLLADDQVYEWLARPFNASGARLFTLFDCCYSGTPLDLRYKLSLDGQNGNIDDMPDNDIEGDVVCLGSSLDSETSADLGSQGGIGTKSFIDVQRSSGHHPSYGKLYSAMNSAYRRTGTAQTCCLSSTNRIVIGADFTPLSFQS